MFQLLGTVAFQCVCIPIYYPSIHVHKGIYESVTESQILNWKAHFVTCVQTTCGTQSAVSSRFLCSLLLTLYPQLKLRCLISNLLRTLFPLSDCGLTRHNIRAG